MERNAETKTVFRWWWEWDFDKEEQWLNQMAQSGWLLDKVGFCIYRFVPTAPSICFPISIPASVIWNG